MVLAALLAVSTTGTVPLVVNFDDTGSSDPGGTIVDYSWNFGDGNFGSGALTNHVYSSEGSYIASLTVTDDLGATGTDSVSIEVQPDLFAAPILSGSSSRGTASLSWTHPGGADGFYLERCKKRKKHITWTVVATLGGGDTSFVDSPGKGSFYYRVQAFRNSPAAVSDYSNQLKFRVR